MLKSLRAPWLSVFLTLLGCGNSDGGSHGSTIPVASAGSAAQGSTSAAGGLNASAGQSAVAANGGAPPIAGLAGSAGTSAGSSASGGSAAGHGSAGRANAGTGGGSLAGGSSGSGGNGAGASSAGNAGSAGNGRGPAPTFTMIYNTVITPNCGGAQCHLKRPTPFGYDFSSKAAASAAWRSDVIAGDGADSPMFQVLNFGIMPKDKPILSVDNLYMVLDWIDAGALDN